MKEQWNIIIRRLKNPSVVLSIVSQIVTVLVLVKAPVNSELVTGIAAAVCSVLTLLGIMSDPDTKTKGYGDDIRFCAQCQKNTQHTVINEKMVCRHCGTESTDPS